MSYLAQYLVFLGEVITLVLAIATPLILLATLKRKGKEQAKEGYLIIKSMRQRFDQTKTEMLSAVEKPKALKRVLKEMKKAASVLEKQASQKKVYVLEFKGDLQASGVTALREEISAVLQVVTEQDEVLIKLESPGGVVHGYGLAASQLDRLRSRSIPLTVSVDKVAASGGYMMACVADKIIAAPFAIIGSIGVMAQLPNFHRWLEKHNIDFEQLTAGEFKRTLSMFGKNTDKGREKFQKELEESHQLFKQFIQQHRPQVNLDQVATGEHWFGQQAFGLALVDHLETSDDYLLQAYREKKSIFEVRYVLRAPLSGRVRQWISQRMTSGVL